MRKKRGLLSGVLAVMTTLSLIGCGNGGEKAEVETVANSKTEEGAAETSAA